MTSRSLYFTAGLAILTSSVKASDEVLLLPAGEFRAKDGRPKNAPAWRMDAEIAAALIAQADAAGVDFVIDYEHQTLLADDNGQPAPAAGWFKTLEWREGDGLYAVGVKWTRRAQDYIEADEYRYVSPVFTYDKTGRVLKLLHVALTNNPALDHQPGVAEAVAAKFSLNPQEESAMKQLLAALGLAETATEDEALAALAALKSNHDTQVAALKSAEPDPARFVSVATLTATQTELQTSRSELAALRAEIAAGELDGVITAALSGGKLLPAQEASMREWGRKDMAALKSFLEAAPVVAPVTTQTGNKGGPDKSHQHTDTDVAVMRAMGLTVEQFAVGKLED